MTHDELQAAITSGTRRRPGLCALMGLWWHHEHDSRRSTAGWVDLVILGLGGAIFAELKVPGDRVRPAQREVAMRLQAADLNYQLWTPADLRSGRIQAELIRIR
jgi:hypothetical protein